MEKVLEYTLLQEDLESTAEGLVNLILKNCLRVTGHEISRAKYTPDGITVYGKQTRVSERMLPGQTLRDAAHQDAFHLRDAVFDVREAARVRLLVPVALAPDRVEKLKQGTL